MDQYWTRNEQEQYTQRMEDEHHRQNKRIENLEKNYEQLTELTISVRDMTKTIGTMSEDIKAQGEQISKIISEPADRWQRVKEKALDTVVGIIVGALVVALFSLVVPYIK